MNELHFVAAANVAQKVGTEGVKCNCGLRNDECGSADPVRTPQSSIHQAILIFTGCTFQIFAAYSRIDLSDENPPMRATLRIDILVHWA